MAPTLCLTFIDNFTDKENKKMYVCRFKEVHTYDTGWIDSDSQL